MGIYMSVVFLFTIRFYLNIEKFIGIRYFTLSTNKSINEKS